ncbi:hypothetical protein KBB12_02000 [Candidatus Woesebacteria bacterium]|nr:hypothetical protein [Candidatus Woesebacteria bacterium]
MRTLFRYVGITFIAVGLAVLMFLIFLRVTNPRRILSPVPDESPIEGVQITPGS